MICVFGVHVSPDLQSICISPQSEWTSTYCLSSRIIIDYCDDRQFCWHLPTKRRQDIEILLGHIGRENEVGAQDLPLVDKLVSLVCRGSDDTKIGPGAAHTPKKIRILLFGDLEKLAIGGNDTRRYQGIGDQTKQTRIASNARTNGQSDIAWAGAGAALCLHVNE